MTKATMLISVGLAAGLAMADGMSIADARKQVADCVSNPSTMTAVVKQLSAADQCAYLGDVVAAVAKLPGSQEEAAAAYVNVSRAALKGASKDNVANMVAEIFATVPPEYLPAISESLAGDMMNRAADPSKTYTDDEYVGIAKKTMDTVNKRVESSDSADVRSAFAALMFVRGSNNASDKVVSAMVESLPESARKSASEEWFPAALADGDKKNYDAMLVAASADDDIPPEVLTKILIRLPVSQTGVALVSDLNGANVDPTTQSNEKTPLVDMANNPMNDSLPALGAGDAFDTVVESVVIPRGEPTPTAVPSRTGYQGQRIR